MAATFDPGTAPAITFKARNAEAYERVMGQWSRRLAPLLIRFGGLADGDRVVDVGCGTGSLTFTAPQVANVAAVAGIDQAEVYVAHARARNTDPRITIQQADARALPFADAAFDRAFSMLVLQFIPDAARAVAEMRRVVRPGGTVAAAVWDAYGGMLRTRLIWDTAAMLDPAFEPPLFRSLSAPGELVTTWREAGLVDVEETDLVIRMEFADFDDYWTSSTAEGPMFQFVSGLPDSARAALAERVRRAYCANRPDGPRSFASVAWACRGRVPG
ncbi:class I SAM-dependent methyltransferase [Rhodopila globiformis]|uniref:SAM-dependent methyltransferase n=1 Tax=Rhodopila globiformis TaxID=1071 RepID=A0A2S6NK65_RHOGL|nr:class I SAM-dependent methyltransferase [Rhodopila globiformis]PPQ35303.1 SAM-dependent methyltransferase [Rhodopila globiformis]